MPAAAGTVPVLCGGRRNGGQHSAGPPGRRKTAEAAAAHGYPEDELHTSALQIRPPREEVERRNAEREQAAKAKPVPRGVMQVLLASLLPGDPARPGRPRRHQPLVLWVEYNRGGFPGDGDGSSTDDRMTYGSHAVDYLGNWAGPRYLGELVDRNKDQLSRRAKSATWPT